MPRYFFDVHDGRDRIDEDGLQCANLAAARAEAIQTAGEIIKDFAEDWTGESWSMIVRDEAGAVVAALTFRAS